MERAEAAERRVAELEAEVKALLPYRDAIHNAHNGYTAKGRGPNPVPEPETPEQAIRELNESWEKLEDMALDRALKAEAENERLRAVVDRQVRFVDTGEPVCEGDEVFEIVGRPGQGDGACVGLGRARMIIDDDWEEREFAGYKTRDAAEAARAAKGGDDAE